MALAERSKQTFLNIPMDVEGTIESDHIVRKIIKDVTNLDLSPLKQEYNKMGRPGIPVENLFSLLLFGYTRGIYTTRKLEMACKENICFMYIMQGKKPDHSTIHKFQQLISRHESELMSSQVQLLLEKGLLDLSTISIDGTKIQSVANKYSNVYRGSIGYHEKNLENKIIDTVINAFNGNTSSATIEDYTVLELPSSIDSLINKPNPNSNKLTNSKSLNRKYIARLELDDYITLVEWLITLTPEEINSNKQIKTLYKEIDGFFLRKLKYLSQREILGDRNSYSKTDNDASFMRLKDDSFDSKILSPAYNMQLASSNGFIVGLTLTNQASDTRQLLPLIEKLETTSSIDESTIILADAGYGSMENYEILESKNLEHLIPYMTQRFEHKRKYLKNEFRNEKFIFHDKEYAICPNGEKLEYIDTRTTISPSGFTTNKDVYTTNKCSSCSFKDQCTKNGTSKTIYNDKKWNAKKIEIYEKTSLPENAELYKLRSIVEQNFGILKHNHKMSRFRNYGIKMNLGISTIAAIACNIQREYNMQLA